MLRSQQNITNPKRKLNQNATYTKAWIYNQFFGRSYTATAKYERTDFFFLSRKTFDDKTSTTRVFTKKNHKKY